LGKDNYASVSFDNVPQGKRVIIGWMSNWEYAQEVPTEAWRSSTTMAREVSLKKTKDGYILKNIPVAGLKNYQGKSIRKKSILRLKIN
jgi:levanase/fructan beta-fructosidase